jgi:inorganic pyrophosphatase
MNRKEQVYSFFGKTVDVVIDRPIGTVHPKHDDVIYPINYGYIPGVIAPDGEELDVYVLGVTAPIEAFTGRVIAIVHRENDIEDKLVAAPDGMRFSKEEIAAIVSFQEQFYDSAVEVYGRDASAIPAETLI